MAIRWNRAVLSVAALASCSAGSYVAEADRVVSRTLHEATERVLGDHENQVIVPGVQPDDAGETGPEASTGCVDR